MLNIPGTAAELRVRAQGHQIPQDASCLGTRAAVLRQAGMGPGQSVNPRPATPDFLPFKALPVIPEAQPLTKGMSMPVRVAGIL